MKIFSLIIITGKIYTGKTFIARNLQKSIKNNYLIMEDNISIPYLKSLIKKEKYTTYILDNCSEKIIKHLKPHALRVSKINCEFMEEL